MAGYRALLKHSGNYLLATIATKALAFISIPVYTYLLTVEEYGIFNIFISTVGISTVLLTLNTEVAISRYYYDSSDILDFKRFVGTSVRLISIVFIIMSIVLVVFSKPLSQYLNLDVPLTIAIIPVSLYNIVNSIFQQIYQPLLQSKKIAAVSSIQAYLSFALSVVAILLLDDKKYYGQVFGTIAAMIIIGSYSLRQIKPYYERYYSKEHIKYLLHYSIPYLPYSLSGILLAQFGKLIMGQKEGFESAGMYSFASNIASLMLVLISVIHSAWNPFYFQNMKDSNYKKIDEDYDLIWRCTIICAILLILFSPELALLLGQPDFFGSLQIIPFLAVGYCFYQWSYVYMRNVGYAKKTIWNAGVVVSSGVVNIILSYILIDKYGDIGVSISFCLSYFVMLFLGWLVNKYFLKVYAPAILNFISPLILLSPVVICAWLQLTSGNFYLDLLIKFVVSIFCTIYLFYPWKEKIYNFIKSIN